MVTMTTIAPTRTVHGRAPFEQVIGSADPHDIEAEQRVLHVVLSCRHRKDYTSRINLLPPLGSEHACWSSCDGVGRHTRTVTKIEWGDKRYSG